MMYRVIKSFTDLQDGNYLYRVGDEFPRTGKKVTDERIDELASPDNRQRTPLIKADTEPVAEPTAEVVEDAPAEVEDEHPKRRKHKKSE